MICKIWSEKAESIERTASDINQWISRHEQQGYVVVDQSMAGAPIAYSGSFERSPYITIVVWMEERGIDTKGLGS